MKHEGGEIGPDDARFNGDGASRIEAPNALKQHGRAL